MIYLFFSVIEDHSITLGLRASTHIQQLSGECLWLWAVNKSDYRCVKLMTLPIIMAVRVKFSERQEYNNDNYTMLK